MSDVYWVLISCIICFLIKILSLALDNLSRTLLHYSNKVIYAFGVASGNYKGVYLISSSKKYLLVISVTAL